MFLASLELTIGGRNSSLIDYIAISGSMERNVLEFVDHLHEHFITPCSINAQGRYNVPSSDNEGYRYVKSVFVMQLINSGTLHKITASK